MGPSKGGCEVPSSKRRRKGAHIRCCERSSGCQRLCQSTSHRRHGDKVLHVPVSERNWSGEDDWDLMGRLIVLFSTGSLPFVASELLVTALRARLFISNPTYQSIKHPLDFPLEL